MIFPRFRRVLTAVLFVAPVLCGQNVSVFAGAKPPLTRGGGQAVNTPLGKISAIAVDHAGTVYFADASQALIMSVTPDGLLTVIAGNGSMQVSDPPQGDGGPAIDAPIPWAGMPIVLDGSGNLFIADDSNIREITTDGIIHTVLRGSQYGLNGAISGLTIDAQGRLFLAELMSHCVWRLDPDGTLTKIAGNGTYSTPTSGGPATNTGLGEACGVAVDSAGNVYVADSSDGLILQVNASDRTIRTFAGAPDPNTGNSTLWDVDSLAFDHQGNLFAFYGVASLARVSQDGAVSPIPLGQWGYSGDGGPASSAQFVGSDAFTNQFAIDDAGNIFFPDGGNGRLRKIDTSGIVNTIAGNGDYRFAGDGGFAKDALLSAPNYVSFGVNGELYVSDSGNHRVRRITPDGVIQTAAGNGETYFAGSTPPAGVPASSSPVGIDIYAATGASDGGFYFSEAWFIRKVDAGGTVSTVAGTLDGYGEPPDGSPAVDLLLGDVEGLALGPDQCLYFTDENVIGKLNPDGSFSTVAGDPTLSGGFSGDGGPALRAKLGSARGLAFDLWSSDRDKATGGSNRGNSLEVASRPPWRISPVSPSHWNQAPFYFADGFYGRVRKVDSQGIVSTIAGNGGVGYSGDGGPALQATLFYPQAVTVDKGGYVYVSDWGNGVVRRIAPDGIITTLVGGLMYPAGLAVDAKGTLYVADPGNNRIVAVANPQQ